MVNSPSGENSRHNGELSGTHQTPPSPSTSTFSGSQSSQSTQQSTPPSTGRPFDQPKTHSRSSSAPLSPVTEVSSEKHYSTVSALAKFPLSDFIHDPESDSRNTPERAPWKYFGYEIFSKWLATDSAFLIVRRFGALNARILLSMQDEIVQLEQELEDIEVVLSDKTQDRSIKNGSFRSDPYPRRKEIVKDILPKKLAEYHSFINGYTQMLTRQDIHRDDLTAVKRWLGTHKKGIDEEEAVFMTKDDDLIGLKPKSRSCFRYILEYTFLRIPGVRNLFTRNPMDEEVILKNDKLENKKTRWQDDKKVEGLSSWLVALIGLGMLLGPLWILASVNEPKRRLGIITAFIALFFGLVKVATRARIFDALAAAAAYSAVLMVFLQAIAI